MLLRDMLLIAFGIITETVGAGAETASVVNLRFHARLRCMRNKPNVQRV